MTVSFRIVREVAGALHSVYVELGRKSAFAWADSVALIAELRRRGLTIVERDEK